MHPYESRACEDKAARWQGACPTDAIALDARAGGMRLAGSMTRALAVGLVAAAHQDPASGLSNGYSFT